MSYQPYPRLAAGPILEAIRVRQLVPGWKPDAVWKLVQRARTQGIVPFWSADVICVRLLGVHPASVYGEAWWDVIAA